MDKPDADYEVGGYWGAHLTWWTKGHEWQNLSKDGFVAKAYGHMEPEQQPKEGDTVVSEFKKSWIIFEVTKVRREKDPKDMFWIDCKPVEKFEKPVEQVVR